MSRPEFHATLQRYCLECFDVSDAEAELYTNLAKFHALRGLENEDVGPAILGLECYQALHYD